MGPPLSGEEKFAFLICCLKFGSNLVVDFEKVANECGIVTVSAASQRFHRLMRENGIGQKNSSAGNEGLPVTPKTSRATLTRAPGTSGKKRKLDQSMEPRAETDNEEGEHVKKKIPKSRKKSGAGAGKKEEAIAMGFAGTNDGSNLNDSTAVGELGEPGESFEAAVKAEEPADGA